MKIYIELHTCVADLAFKAWDRNSQMQLRVLYAR